MRVAAIALVLVACGRINFVPSPETNDLLTLPDAAPIDCLPNFEMMDTGCYRIETALQPWLNAELACETHGAHLVVVDDAVELEAMHAILLEHGTPLNAEMWIGESDRVTRTRYLSVTGRSVTFLPWGAGQPDATFDDCLEIRAAGAVLYDQNCDEYLNISVCEYDGIPAQPSVY